MAYSFSQMTDDQLAAVVEDLHNNPLTRVVTPYDQQVAVTQELARRRAMPREEANQAANNDAAATPIMPDAAVKDPRTRYRDDLVTAGWSEEQADRFTEQEAGKPHPFAFGVNPESERAAVGRAAERDARHSAQEAYWKDVYGHNDEPPMSTSFEMRTNGSAYGALPDFGGGETDMVDGVEVPVVDLGDGRMRYRLGDVRRAQDAAADARWLAGHRQMVADDIAKYGHYTLRDTDDALTPEQEENRNARKRAETNQRAQVERQREARIASKNRELTPYEQEQNDRRKLRANMASLAGGSSGLRGGPGGNMEMFRALAMLEGVDPGKMDAQQQAMMQMMPMDPRRAAVEAQNMANAGDVIKRGLTGAAAGLMADPGARQAADRAAELNLQNAQAQQAGGIAEDAEALVGEYAYNQNMFNWLPRMIGLGNTPLNRSLLTVDEEEKAIRRLRAKHPHLTYEQALAHIAAAAANTTRQRDMAAPPQ